MKSPTGNDMRQNAENCRELAEESTDLPARKRYERMQEAWKSLAETQDWLDGKKRPDENPTKAEN